MQKELVILLEAAYREMAQDEEREAEAFEWIEAIVGDSADATWQDIEPQE